MPNDDAHSTKLLTIPDVAQRTGLSTRFIWQMLASGQLTAIRFGRRATRIDEAELERFIDDARDQGRSS